MVGYVLVTWIGYIFHRPTTNFLRPDTLPVLNIFCPWWKGVYHSKRLLFLWFCFVLFCFILLCFVLFCFVSVCLFVVSFFVTVPSIYICRCISAYSLSQLSVQLVSLYTISLCFQVCFNMFKYKIVVIACPSARPSCPCCLLLIVVLLH